MAVAIPRATVRETDTITDMDSATITMWLPVKPETK